METMQRVEPATPTAPARAPREREIRDLNQEYRRLAWLAGFLAVASIGLSAWVMVRFTLRCVSKEMSS